MARNMLYYENRIALLESRKKDNGRIIAKLRREMRKLAAAGQEKPESK